MTRASLAVAILTGLTLHAALLHLLLSVSSDSRQRRDFYFGLTALLVAGYDFCCIGLYSSHSLEAASPWFRGQAVFIALASFSFLFFLESYANVPIPRWVRRLAWIVPGAGAIAIFERRGWLLTTEPAIKHVSTRLLGDLTYHEYAAGPLLHLMFVGLASLILVSLWMAARARDVNPRKRARSILVAVLIFGVGALHDLLVASGFRTSIYLIEYSWTSIIVLVAFSLSREVQRTVRIREELALSQEKLRQVERLKYVGQLAGGIAHDLNNMLTPVIGYAELARSAVHDPARTSAYLEHLVGGAERAASLTRQLLAFARKQVLEMRPLDVAEHLRHFEPLLRGLLPENVSLKVICPEPVPLIDGDRAQLEQVWMNLAANARDAMPHGGHLCFRVEPVERSGLPATVVTVSDTGKGMTPDTLEHAFEPFFTTKPRGQGTGLGLSSVQGILSQHNAEISARSVPDQGTTFKITFPPASATPTQETTADVRVAVRSTLQGKRALVVDDDSAVLTMVGDLLLEAGCTITLAASRTDVERLLESPALAAGVDLLVTDVMLTDSTGPDVCRVVKERFPRAAVLFMSGHSDEVLAPRGALSGNVTLLRKPFALDDLLEHVQQSLGRAN